MPMRSRSMAVAIALSLACAAGAVGCYLRASALRGEADWMMARGTAQAQEYARSFDGQFADQQMVDFEQHRALQERAQVWQLLQRLLVLGCVMAGFSTYVLYLFRRLRDQLVDASIDPADGDVASLARR